MYSLQRERNQTYKLVIIDRGCEKVEWNEVFSTTLPKPFPLFRLPHWSTRGWFNYEMKASPSRLPLSYIPILYGIPFGPIHPKGYTAAESLCQHSVASTCLTSQNIFKVIKVIFNSRCSMTNSWQNAGMLIRFNYSYSLIPPFFYDWLNYCG